MEKEKLNQGNVVDFNDDELLELLDDIGTAYMTCTHHPLTHIEYGTPAEINVAILCQQ